MDYVYERMANKPGLLNICFKRSASHCSQASHGWEEHAQERALYMCMELAGSPNESLAMSMGSTRSTNQKAACRSGGDGP